MMMHFRLQYSMSLWNIKIQITYEFLYLMIVKNLLKCRSQNLRNQIFLALFFENLLRRCTVSKPSPLMYTIERFSTTVLEVLGF